MSFAKGLLGLVVASGVAGASVIAVQNLSSEEITKTISEITTETYSGKFGEYHADLFLAVSGDHNKNIWNKKFKTLGTPETTGFFKAVTNDKKTLEEFKNACKSAYEADTPTSTSTDTNKWNEVWKYCFEGDEKPITINEDTEEKKKTENNKEWNGKLGDNKKTDLVSITSEKNKVFWSRRNKKKVDSSDKFFSHKKTENKTIQESCKEAYAIASAASSSSTTSPTEIELYKYCSLIKKST